MNDSTTTRRFVFHGRVQGVGFRWTTRDVARRFEVAGFVRNQSDGTVELVVQAEPREIEAFVAAVEEAMAGHVDVRKETPFDSDETFDGFAIRR